MTELTCHLSDHCGARDANILFAVACFERSAILKRKYLIKRAERRNPRSQLSVKAAIESTTLANPISSNHTNTAYYETQFTKKKAKESAAAAR